MINATMLGLSPREARRRFDGIIDFAELRDFTEVKLKNYSSGMMVRLAFSVMIQVDADILLIDEVLAVGDAAFQQKCFEEFERIKRSGTTVLLVTHDMGSVDRFCDRAMLLEHGAVAELGDPHHVGLRYLQLNFSRAAPRPARPRPSSGRDRRAGPARRRVGRDHRGVVRGRARRARRVPRVRTAGHGGTAGALRGRRRGPDLRHRAHQHPEPHGRRRHDAAHRAARRAASRPARRSRCASRSTTSSAPDRYALSASVARAGSGMDFCDHREEAATVVVRRHDVLRRARRAARRDRAPARRGHARGGVGVSTVAADVDAIRGRRDRGPRPHGARHRPRAGC